MRALIWCVLCVRCVRCVRCVLWFMMLGVSVRVLVCVLVCVCVQNRNPVEFVGFYRRATTTNSGGGGAREASRKPRMTDAATKWSAAQRIPPQRVSCLIPKVFSEQ